MKFRKHLQEEKININLRKDKVMALAGKTFSKSEIKFLGNLNARNNFIKEILKKIKKNQFFKNIPSAGEEEKNGYLYSSDIIYGEIVLSYDSRKHLRAVIYFDREYKLKIRFIIICEYFSFILQSRISPEIKANCRNTVLYDRDVTEKTTEFYVSYDTIIEFFEKLSDLNDELGRKFKNIIKPLPLNILENKIIDFFREGQTEYVYHIYNDKIILYVKVDTGSFSITLFLKNINEYLDDLENYLNVVINAFNEMKIKISNIPYEDVFDIVSRGHFVGNGIYRSPSQLIPINPNHKNTVKEVKYETNNKDGRILSLIQRAMMAKIEEIFEKNDLVFEVVTKGVKIELKIGNSVFMILDKNSRKYMEDLNDYIYKIDRLQKKNFYFVFTLDANIQKEVDNLYRYIDIVENIFDDDNLDFRCYFEKRKVTFDIRIKKGYMKYNNFQISANMSVLRKDSDKFSAYMGSIIKIIRNNLFLEFYMKKKTKDIFNNKFIFYDN